MKTRFFILLSLIFCFNTFISQANSKLFYTKERVSSVKSRIQKDNLLNKSWGDIKSVADAQLKRNSIDKLDYLSLAYLFTDDEAYSEKIIQLLEDVVKVETWGSYEMLNRKPAWRSDLNTGKKSLMTAIGYNAVYDKLTASQKKKISQALYRLGVEPLLGDWLMEPTRIHSLNSMGHNWWTSCVCMGGILALSISNEVPEARRCADAVYEHLPEWFDFSGDVLQHKPKSFDKAGGMYESLGYANFGIQEALLFYLAWGNMKNDVKLPEITQLDNLCDFFLHVCYPRTDILYNLNFGDSHKYISAESSMMLLYALGVKDEKILWYINQVEQGQHRDGYFLNRPMGFLYTPDLKKLRLYRNWENRKSFQTSDGRPCVHPGKRILPCLL